jgi:hypothetical protein
LHNVEDRLLASAKLTLRLDILSAKLRVYAAQAAHSLSHHRRSVESPEASTKDVWYKGFHVALQIAHLATEPEQGGGLTPADDAQAERLTLFYPKHYFQKVVVATVYLITFIAIVRDIPARDKTLARNRIKQVFESFMAKSTADYDEPARTAMVFELLSRYAEDEAAVPFFLEVAADSSPAALHNAVKVVAKIRRAAPHNKPFTAADQSQASAQSQASDAGADISVFQHEGDPLVDNGFVMSDWDNWMANAGDLMGLLDPNYNNLLQNHWA